ncbi:MAG: tRNA (N6-isopentenyl adenosine(37)-C2)-methylthiotransferase MiaB [SAR86 cluster bacterium]|jgi:tRNA-2-methylthio-N6-dimethylallyladenosine synthase|nr:tRNA (N6-isopentenyl adenosine(37)-C2)-methylthiotransferase MiaB [Gammaproteobacteria bacterium]MDO7578297.1 tRNA (N6-isopentenyl adenosine(37)-C2)-methylthiotransferase MiaB [SAR86 cluster bacterium]MDB9737959.1 tRNA (N6-isopentenyl adenosine(37)-C2)-methylthiotransferase MiaB [Gammaproteobacteria bacterium]MDC3398827.1 tRNA (N6-isopentenyl adenosine(37)-C2)-methylthiotransferase MiaB [Gammaproteobacteria bacterium]MDO7600803.1 tRNA (N6-isopentenyl adenosine(37)-C2)-methylthiotransferase M
MGTKLYIKTYGCQMNEYDSQKTLEILKQDPTIEETSNPEDADIILLNTCSIREKAEEKVYSELGRLRKLKIENPNLKIGVGGCVASQEGKNIFKRAPYVDLIFGPQTIHKVPSLLSKKNKIEAVDVSFPIEEKFDSLPAPEATGTSSFVSIMEGCSKYCSFCVVPYTRGDEVSRKPEQIFNEVARLVEQGVSEIVFVGQNVNSYEYSFNGRMLRLSDLIEVTGSIDGVERIRYTTSHPLDMTDDLIEVYGHVPQLVSHLHLPVQSGSNTILTRMKRNYSRELYIDVIEKLKLVRPNIKVSSDFIVGFPGETDADFQQTMDLIEEVQFDASFSFIYSARPGTPASKLQDVTALAEKKERLNILQNRIDELQTFYSDALAGTIQRCLVTGISRKNIKQLQARTECNRVVNFDFQNINILGKLVDINITKSYQRSLVGKILNSEELQSA